MTLYHLAVVDVNGGNYRDVPSLDSARAPDWTMDGILYQSEAGMQRTFDKPSAASELVITDYLKPFFDDPAERPGGGVIVYQGKEASHTEIFGVNPGRQRRPCADPPGDDVGGRAASAMSPRRGVPTDNTLSF